MDHKLNVRSRQALKMSFCNEAVRLNRWMRRPWIACWKGSANVNQELSA